MIPNSAFPLCWPPGRVRRKYPTRSRFADIGFGRARDTLMNEIYHLGGSKIILSSDVPLKADGMPYANRNQPSDKGVAVYFIFNKKPMVFACDEWDRIEHNMWAIAKTIEALRGIRRWGSGDMVERAFTGFTALPSPAVRKHWREILGFMGVGHVPNHLLMERRNELALKHHPDVGGEAERMTEINCAFQEALEELE